jgi:iron complex outermembrane receptor protein
MHNQNRNTQSRKLAQRPLSVLIALLCAGWGLPALAATASATSDQADAAQASLTPATDEPAANSDQDLSGKRTPAANAKATELESVIVTGTRVKGRSPTESMSPIDVFSPADLERQSAADFTDQLSNIAPSFNSQRFPIADGTAFIRPANLRNLPPDETLVLVNGKRRHRSALVNLQAEPFGTVNQGAQAVDFALFPTAAIRSVEVLRDGASAQYGSDAIAGVINIVLNDNPEGISINSQYGSTYEGDGDRFQSSANLGLPLGNDGFFNLTAEYFNSNHTSRGSARPDAVRVGQAVGIDKVPFNGLGQRWGSPDSKGLLSFFNAETAIGESSHIYAFGSYSDEEFSSSFFYRDPVGVPGVTPRGTLQVDANGDGLPDPVDQSIIDSILAAGLNPSTFVTADPNSPSGFVALNPIFSRFPGGYTPTFGADIKDYEGVLGARGELSSGLRWDFSGRYGQNQVIYRLVNSINPSLGSSSPISFTPGKLEQRERGINADFVYPLENQLFAAPLNIAFGGEWRREIYAIATGDPASFANGPTAALFGVGSDGFQGDSPESAGTFGRSSAAAYLDLETELVEDLSAGLSGRFEDSAQFSSQFDWKLSLRYAFSPKVAIRATANTGFRAPTPGQINTLDVTTTANASGTLVPLGTFPVNNPAAIALGALPLQPEHSTSYSAGLVLTPTETFSFTLDYYNIDINDRVALSNFTILPGSPEQQALIDAGVPNAALLGSVSFFSNAFDSTVEGVDVAANWRVEAGDTGDLVFDLRHSYNDQTVDRFDPGTIDGERVFDLENQLPNHRSIFTIDYRHHSGLDLLVRANRYGGWEDSTFGERAQFGSEVLIDVAITYPMFDDRFRVTLGANNVFDNLPDRETNSTLSFLGATRPLSSPFGFTGGEWFLRIAADL